VVAPSLRGSVLWGPDGMTSTDEKTLRELRERAAYYRWGSDIARSPSLKERLYATVIACEAEIRAIEARYGRAAA
jgi:hypothetical protein